MKILLMDEWKENPSGGMESLKTLGEELSEEHEVKFLWLSDRNEKNEQETHIKTYTNILSDFMPLEVERLGFFIEPLIRSGYMKQIREFQPDLIIAQTQAAKLALKYSEARTILFLRAYELLYTEEFSHRGNHPISKIVNPIARKLNARYADEVLSNADTLIANSEYVKEKYREVCRREIEVVHPFIDLEDYTVEETGGKILHVNPSKKKGIETTLNVAESMPEEQFLIVGEPEEKEIKQKIEKLENVENPGYIDDMKEAYRQTKIALVPSKWEEPFGRVPIEAGASGIPSIVTKKGGLPESTGNKELTIENKASMVRDAIQTADSKYDLYSKEARKKAKSESKESQIRALRGIIER
jgi:glycosyltransferase involved in cell wall biosynthesis